VHNNTSPITQSPIRIRVHSQLDRHPHMGPTGFVYKQTRNQWAISPSQVFVFLAIEWKEGPQTLVAAAASLLAGKQVFSLVFGGAWPQTAAELVFLGQHRAAMGTQYSGTWPDNSSRGLGYWKNECAFSKILQWLAQITLCLLEVLAL